MQKYRREGFLLILLRFLLKATQQANRIISISNQMRQKNPAKIAKNTDIQAKRSLLLQIILSLAQINVTECRISNRERVESAATAKILLSWECWFYVWILGESLIRVRSDSLIALHTTTCYIRLLQLREPREWVRILHLRWHGMLLFSALITAGRYRWCRYTFLQWHSIAWYLWHKISLQIQTLKITLWSFVGGGFCVVTFI